MDKKYTDSDDIPRTIEGMITYEPAWVASRFRFMETESERKMLEIADLKAQIKSLEKQLQQSAWAGFN